MIPSVSNLLWQWLQNDDFPSPEFLPIYQSSFGIPWKQYISYCSWFAQIRTPRKPTNCIWLKCLLNLLYYKTGFSPFFKNLLLFDEDPAHFSCWDSPIVEFIPCVLVTLFSYVPVSPTFLQGDGSIRSWTRLQFDFGGQESQRCTSYRILSGSPKCLVTSIFVKLALNQWVKTCQPDPLMTKSHQHFMNGFNNHWWLLLKCIVILGVANRDIMTSFSNLMFYCPKFF